jgi:hypothetical protein
LLGLRGGNADEGRSGQQHQYDDGCNSHDYLPVNQADIDRSSDSRNWRSQGENENPTKSTGLPVLPIGNRTLFHKENFDLWQTDASYNESA